MPKSSLHMLSWSEERQRYELHTRGHLQLCFWREDERSWQDWLTEQRSFAFEGRYGHVSVVKEVRPRGSGYWYAYRSIENRTVKRYLGQSARITLARLEEAARIMTAEQTPRAKHAQTFPVAHMLRKSRKLLPETKLVYPRLPAPFVERERLLRELDAALTHRLLLLSASAGSGKTTLLSAWVEQSSHLVAWLSLDELDNDPVRFWSAVIMALRTCLPEIGDLALAMLSTSQPLSTVLTALINEILACGDETILILDDYHVIEEQTIQDALLFLLDHLPANLHLIIASRADPPQPLTRLRIRGQLAEIRELAVRFTQEEVAIFLQQRMGIALAQEEVALLGSRTEGWIAGLQLAALSLRAQADPVASVQRFSGGQRFVQDYVLEEIFLRQPLPLQRFLLRVSGLTRMNAALCQALTEEPASQELLETLEHKNLFVVPLDEQRQWYRLHALFREVLFTRLQASEPALVRVLHQRAAHWYAEHDDIHEAMAHALKAQDYVFAASVMEQASRQLWLQGEAKTLASWVLLLPVATLQAHINFVLTVALNLLLSTSTMPEPQRMQALAQSEQIIARVESVSIDCDVEAEGERLQSRISLLREFVVMGDALRTGNILQVREVAQRMQLLARDEPVAWKWPALYGLFVSAQLLGDAVLLLPNLLAMKLQALQEQDRATVLVVMCWIAAAHLYAGNLRLLLQECLHVQDLLAQAGEPVAVAAYPAFDLSFLYYARNQLEQAEASLQVALQQARRWQDMNLLVWGYAMNVRLLVAAGKMVEAEQALQQAQQLMLQSGSMLHASDVAAAQVTLWLARGDLSTATSWAAHCVFDPQDYTRAEEYVVLAHVYLAQRRYAECLQLLEPLLSRMERFERHWDTIHLLAAQSVALYRLGEITRAKQVAVHLLTLTEQEGHIRVYLDAGEPMRRVLQALHNEPHSEDAPLSASCILYVSALLTTFEQEGRRDVPQAAVPDKNTAIGKPVPPAQNPLATSLSPQEQRVLSLLVAGRTYAEMAQELVVSLNTIKTQVSSIYRKLDVSRRAEASVVAQQLHLL